MKKYLALFVGAAALSWAKVAAAVCPVCAVAVGAGVGVSRWLGVDDAVVGLWVGALTAAMSAWTVNWLESKGWRWPFRDYLVVAAYYGLAILPLPFLGLTGKPLQALPGWGIDHLLLGVIVGSLVFWAAAVWYEELKARRGGHAWFPFQKVVMPVGSLAVLSLIYYLILN